MNKIISIFLQLVISFAVIYLLSVNIQNSANLSFVRGGNITLLSTSVIIIGVYLAGIITGAMQSFVNKGAYQSQIEFYARKNEKLAQQNEIDSDDKEALQRKIATLEIALENALKKQ